MDGAAGRPEEERFMGGEPKAQAEIRDNRVEAGRRKADKTDAGPSAQPLTQSHGGVRTGKALETAFFQVDQQQGHGRRRDARNP